MAKSFVLTQVIHQGKHKDAHIFFCDVEKFTDEAAAQQRMSELYKLHPGADYIIQRKEKCTKKKLVKVKLSA